MPKSEPMPPRGTVDPLFDGHHERPFTELTAVEKLDWLWATMELVHAARKLPAEQVSASETSSGNVSFATPRPVEPPSS